MESNLVVNETPAQRAVREIREDRAIREARKEPEESRGGATFFGIVSCIFALCLLGSLTNGSASSVIIFAALSGLFAMEAYQVPAAAKKSLEAAEKVKADAAAAFAEAEREARLCAEERKVSTAQRRDADTQSRPYYYKIGRHANETLALRYGIANLDRGLAPANDFAEQLLALDLPLPGVRVRHGTKEANYIALQKIRSAGTIAEDSGEERLMPDVFLVELVDFRNRRALAVIERGTEYVKTFLPLREAWFEEHKALEQVVKGNVTMSLRDIALIHIEKAVK